MVPWYWLFPTFIGGLVLGAFIYYRLLILAGRVRVAICEGIDDGLLISRPGFFSPM